MRVLVIGAGLGGLCLAQGLARAGFDVRVHEKDRRQPVPGLLSLNESGLGALQECLPPHLVALLESPFRRVVPPTLPQPAGHDPPPGLQ